jgi:primosomal protein N'
VVSPIAKIKNLHRFQVLIKASSSQVLHTLLSSLAEQLSKTSGSVRITVEIDPLQFI